jgi:hypothetical protein
MSSEQSDNRGGSPPITTISPLSVHPHPPSGDRQACFETSPSPVVASEAISDEQSSTSNQLVPPPPPEPSTTEACDDHLDHSDDNSTTTAPSMDDSGAKKRQKRSRHESFTEPRYRHSRTLLKDPTRLDRSLFHYVSAVPAQVPDMRRKCRSCKKKTATYCVVCKIPVCSKNVDENNCFWRYHSMDDFELQAEAQQTAAAAATVAPAKSSPDKEME